MVEPETRDVLAEVADPHQLSAVSQDALRELAAEGESANTVRAYQNALRYWEAWFHVRYGQVIAVPVPVATVLQFVVDHAMRKNGLTEMPRETDEALVTTGVKKDLGPPALSTLLLRISSVLSKLHTLHKAPNPCLDVAVREALAGVRKAYAKRGAKPKKLDALTLDPLLQLLETCEATPVGIGDRALLLLAWASGGRRRSEVTQATRENVRPDPTSGGYMFTLDYTKTYQDGSSETASKPILGEAADALRAWIDVLENHKIDKGPIFRRVRRWGAIGEPPTPQAVRQIVKDRVAKGGVEGHFSAHSLRSGFITQAVDDNVPMLETMAMTGHTSVNTVAGYYKPRDMLKSKAASLFKSKPVK